jgi:putative YhgA-like transposase
MSRANADPPRTAVRRAELLTVREFHDRGALWLFEDPRQLRELLQILEPSLAEQLDFSRARRENRSFIPADLRKQESDLIFLVPLQGARRQDVWIYVLLEHQSKPDTLMGLRLYLYMGLLWDEQRRGWEDRRTPLARRRLRPVIPLVYYTGAKRWSTPIGLASLMALPAELERFVPRWETLFLNLRETPPESLTQLATAVGWALRVVQAERAPRRDLEQVLREAMAGIEGLTEEQAGQWLRVAWFLLLLVVNRREESGLAELLLAEARHSKFREREVVTRMGRSILEQAEARGEARGEARALARMLAARFGPLPAEIERALAAAGPERLDSWIERAATVATLAEVGIGGDEPAA